MVHYARADSGVGAFFIDSRNLIEPAAAVLAAFESREHEVVSCRAQIE